MIIALEYIRNWFYRIWPRSRSFTIVFHELVGDQTERRIPIEPFKPLCQYIQDWGCYDRVIIKSRGIDKIVDEGVAALYSPMSGDRIEFYPSVGVKQFSDAYIARLNRTSGQGGGRFLKAVVLTESTIPLVKHYYVDNDKPIVFEGHTYNVLPMQWSGFEITNKLSLGRMTVTVPNMIIKTQNGDVSLTTYVEEVDILEQDAELQVLHSDLLSDTNASDRLLLQVQSIEANDVAAGFSLGLNLGLNDLLPRGVITKTEFPGIADDVVHFGT